MRRVVSCLLAGCVFTIAACGGKSSASSSSSSGAAEPSVTNDAGRNGSSETIDPGVIASEDAPAQFCTAFCSWKQRCGKGDAECLSSCRTDANKFSARWRAEYWAGVTGCFNALACGQSDDLCMTNLKYGDPAYPETTEVEACLVHHAECKSFSDDYCLTIAALTDEARGEAHACRSKPCSETKDCLRAAGAFTF